MKKPNVIYLVLDDMGFSNIGCFGGEVRTPNIDKLASNGLRYNNFCVCPASSPIRASLLTGRDNNAVGMGSIRFYNEVRPHQTLNYKTPQAFEDANKSVLSESGV